MPRNLKVLSLKCLLFQVLKYSIYLIFQIVKHLHGSKLKKYTVKISLFHLFPNLLIPISLTPGNHHSQFLVYLTGVYAKYSLEFLLLFNITVLRYFNRVLF